MFQKIAKFFIENSKLTLILVLVTFIAGIGSYILLPKQYNPTIIVPAFNVFIDANGIDSKQISNIIISPLENKLMELEGIDEVYGISGDNYGSVMVKFHIGVDKEKAKIRLTQKLNENLDLKPIGVGNPIITTIDPDELSQIVFGISYIGTGEDQLSREESYIYLKQIANILKDNIKTVKDTTTLDIIGGLKKNIIISLDIQKLEAKNIDILSVYSLLKNNSSNKSLGNINLDNGDNILIESIGKLDEIEKLKKIIISSSNDNVLYLEDIASIKYGVNKILTNSDYSDSINTYDTVFLGVGKALGTNSIFVTNNVLNKLEEVKKSLPKDIKITTIFNEGIKAKDATNMLIINLIQSIIIVFLVLAFYLGIKNALNIAISIPLTLGMVFVLALIFGENINRITLFALILVLGMLVDDSTVVVENINRHLNDRINTGKTKLEAILIAIKEVELGVILSTVTRLLAFGAMFAVGGMMGEYMGPIPKFSLMASVISTTVALTINPWISFNLTKNVNSGDKIQVEKKESRFKFRKKYLNFMSYFLGDENIFIKRRKIFKRVFWLTLLLIIILPIYLGIFKARMLPKSNQDQIYIWIDAPRGWGVEKTMDINNYLKDLLLNNNNEVINLELKNHINYITSTIGQAYVGEFANLFRGGLSRVGENQISLRINLYTPGEYNDKYNKKRLKSEKFTINLRDDLKKALLQKYPDLKISLLEDPPGPPVKSTFLAKIKGNASDEDMYKFSLKVKNEIEKIAYKQSLVDIGDSISSTYRKINLILDHESISRSKLNVNQVENTIAIILNGIDLNLISLSDNLESTNIILVGDNNQKIDINFLNKLSFTNIDGVKIPLSSIARIDYSFVGNEIFTDKREKVIYINGEMGNNSLVYPILELIGNFKNDNFLNGEYLVKSSSLYKIEYIGINDNKKYIIEWGGEWELTLDTFRDLGIAMGISLLAIYFLLVAQFSSFTIAGIIMITFLLGFFGVFPGFSFLYLLNGEYFSATSMIGVIALAGIVVGNAIILIEYVNILKNNGLTIKDALLRAGYVRFMPIILTSMTTVFGAATIIGDPVWSGLAWTIIWGLLVSSILTLIVIPIFYYDSQKKYWN